MVYWISSFLNAFQEGSVSAFEEIHKRYFGRQARQVTLTDDEAYFDVKHDVSRPFVVDAGRTRTQVLGTVFSVRAYRSLSDVRVTVASGKVGVHKSKASPGAQTVFLLPDEQLVVDNQSGRVQKEHVNARSLAVWIRGALDFNMKS